jgi:hypothetical protein
LSAIVVPSMVGERSSNDGELGGTAIVALCPRSRVAKNDPR